VCALPVLFGFVLPVLFMLRPLVGGWDVLPWTQFVQWARNSVRLAGLSVPCWPPPLALAGLCPAAPARAWLTRGVVQLVGLGYAVPGAVIVVGLLLPVGWLQAVAPGSAWATGSPPPCWASSGPTWCASLRWPAVGAERLRAHPGQPGRFGPHAGHHRLGPGLRVHWPLLRRSTAAAALLVFVDVMKELPATLVLRPFNSDTLAVVTYQLARDERLGEAALPALTLVLVGLVPVILLSRTLRQRERDGVRYAQAVYAAQEAADHWRYVARRVAYGDPAAPLDQARGRFDQALQALQALQGQLGERLDTGEAWRGLEQAVQKSRTAPGSDAQAIYNAMTELSGALTGLQDVVTDRSGLALDPEIASRYLVSGSLLHAPNIIRRTGELRGLAGAALRDGRIEPAQAIRLAQLRAVLLHELDLARADMVKAREAAGPAGARGMMMETFDAAQAYLQAVQRQFPPGRTELQGDATALIEQANQLLGTQYRQAARNLGVLDELLAARERRLWRDLWIALAVTVLSLLLALLLAMGFYRAMFGGFKALRRHLMAISMGDLRTDINGKGRDEVSDLLREVGYMQESLRQTVRQVQGASDSVVQASLEIAEGTNDLSTRTEAAAAALEESSAALEQTTSSVQHTAESARQAADIAIDNARVAERGGAVMQDVVKTMERIQSSSRRINEIIGVIDGIAFQTNILALNAAVEAARAGRTGPRVCGRRRRGAQPGAALGHRRAGNPPAHRGQRDRRRRRHGGGARCGRDHARDRAARQPGAAAARRGGQRRARAEHGHRADRPGGAGPGPQHAGQRGAGRADGGRIDLPARRRGAHGGAGGRVPAARRFPGQLHGGGHRRRRHHRRAPAMESQAAGRDRRPRQGGHRHALARRLLRTGQVDLRRRQAAAGRSRQFQRADRAPQALPPRGRVGGRADQSAALPGRGRGAGAGHAVCRGHQRGGAGAVIGQAHGVLKPP
jgi:methyl-accepting chemotaxis protein